MRVMRRILLALVVLIVLAGVGLAVLLPRVAGSPRFRASIAELAQQNLGRRLDFGELSVGLLPPSIVVGTPTIAGRTPEEPPLLRAEALSLRLALLPLLGGVVLVDSLVVEGASVHLVRTADGIVLPTPPAAPATPAAEEPTPADGGGPSFAVRSLSVRDSRVTLVDETLKPPVGWALEQLSVDASGTSPEAPIAVELSARLASGGGIAARGTATLAGRLDLDVELDAIALAAAARYLDPGARLDAALSGQIALEGEAASPERLDLDLELSSERVSLGETRLRGPVGLKLGLAGDLASPSGRFELDGRRAVIEQGEVFRKPEGTPLELAGRFGRDASGSLTVDVERLTLASLKGTGKLESGKQTRLRLDAPSFDLAGWDALVPALADYRPSGRVAMKGLTLTPEPLAVRGTISLEGLRVSPAEGRSIGIQGHIEGRGNALDLRDFDLEAGGQHIALRGGLEDLSGKQRLALQFNSAGVLRARKLLGALSSQGDSLEGPLELDGEITAELAAAQSLVDSLRGRFGFRVGQGAGDGREGGRLEGVSALQSMFASVGQLEQSVRLAGALAGQDLSGIERFYGDEFQRLDGRFSLTGGRLETPDLRILYRDYGVKLRGTVLLAGLALDLTGEVELGPQVVAALGADPKQGPIVVPLAKVSGSVDEPKFGFSRQAVAALSQELLTRSGTVGDLTKEAEKYVPGSSELLKKGLGGLLGGGKRE